MSRALLTLPVLAALAGPALAFQDLDGGMAELPNAHRGVVDFHVSRGLRDPESIQFRNVKGYFVTATNRTIICGEANARNAMGGYVGFEPFIVSIYEDGKVGAINPLAVPGELRPGMRASVHRLGC